jgi:hypothetical protein
MHLSCAASGDLPHLDRDTAQWVGGAQCQPWGRQLGEAADTVRGGSLGQEGGPGGGKLTGHTNQLLSAGRLPAVE